MTKKTDKKFSKAKPLNTIAYPSLEDILFALNGYKKQRMYLKTKKFDKDGEFITGCTKIGDKRYSELVDILNAVGILTGRTRMMEEVVQELDDIIRFDY